eukprot:TRINITY_DN11282_c0_g1_i1.p1 TRINITY_DN11282_c0_g1~~TRINITY_DN11282_c0_g1_i1.p1  ORF type:complete len:132 (-),score=29.15 TRINITY_DN11282_c0_g1_i1:105-500(-)
MGAQGRQPRGRAMAVAAAAVVVIILVQGLANVAFLPSAGHRQTAEWTKVGSMLALPLVALPEMATATAESTEEALKPWLDSVIFYAPVLYLALIIAQRLALKDFNKIYIFSAVLFLVPPVALNILYLTGVL